jgi:hypothetical protein
VCRCVCVRERKRERERGRGREHALQNAQQKLRQLHCHCCTCSGRSQRPAHSCAQRAADAPGISPHTLPYTASKSQLPHVWLAFQLGRHSSHPVCGMASHTARTYVRGTQPNSGRVAGPQGPVSAVRTVRTVRAVCEACMPRTDGLTCSLSWRVVGSEVRPGISVHWATWACVRMGPGRRAYVSADQLISNARTIAWHRIPECSVQSAFAPHPQPFQGRTPMPRTLLPSAHMLL